MKWFIALCVSGFVASVKAMPWITEKISTEPQCGVEASAKLIHHNPWLVLLEYYQDDQRIEIRCGGTLIDKNHVITAAHCVRKNMFTAMIVRLGEYDLSSKKDCAEGVCSSPVVRIKVAEVITHPGFNERDHDIAILKLEHEVEYSDFIRPICLPSGKLEDAATLFATGWGEIQSTGLYSEVKKILPLPHWSRDKCQKVYHTPLPKNIICAGGEEGIDTCRGDSGGPLTLVREKTELWGVVSLGHKHCGSKGYPGIYTNVADHLEWIKEIASL